MEIEVLKEQIQRLTEEEAKALLLQVFLRVDLLNETAYPETEFVEGIKQMYERFSHLFKQELEEKQLWKNIHLVFGHSTGGSLKMAFSEYGAQKENRVWVYDDLFSIGPIWHIEEKPGWDRRNKWMKAVMREDWQDNESNLQLLGNLHTIPNDIPITLWIGDNAHEQTGLRFIVNELKNQSNPIRVINATKAYPILFNRPDISYEVLHTGEITDEKLWKIWEQKKTNPFLTEQERNQLVKEWSQLSEGSALLRIWENESIHSVPEDYFDSFIIDKAKYLQSEFKSHEAMKSARVIGEVIGHLEEYVGDTFIEYRLRELIKKGYFEVEGNMKAMRYYSVRYVGESLS